MHMTSYMKTSFLLVITTITALTMASWTYWLAIHKSDELSFLSSVRQAERQQTERTIAQLKVELADMRKQLTLQYSPAQAGKTMTWKAKKRNHDTVAAVQEENILTVMEDRFKSESYDPDWAGRMEEELIGRFKQLNPGGSHLLDAGCRSSLCRIEVYHEDFEAEEQFVGAYAQLDQFGNNDRQRFYRSYIDGNGDRRTLFFSARMGHTLPSLAN